MKYKLINGKPVPAELYDELVAMGVGKDVHLNSCLRTQDAVNWARRQGATLSSQAELYAGFASGRPGFNPANPPGQSTHECRSDGVAYAGPRGRPLRYWQVGIDSSNTLLLRERAAKRGWIFTLTYPGSRGEAQHGNFRKEPKLNVFRPLKKGSKGPRVATLTARLAYLGDLPGVSSKTGTMGFGDKVEKAVKLFQKHWHLTQDGVVGPHTQAQLLVAVRKHKRERAVAKAAAKPTPKPTPGSTAPATGPDVSSYQGDIDWAKVKKAGHDFAIVKATEGLTFDDPTFTKGRVDAIRKAGLALGIYHFARPQPGRHGASEAQHLAKAIRSIGGLRDGDLAPVLDIEAYGTSTLNSVETRRFVDDFLHTIIDELGVQCIIYTGNFWREHVHQVEGDLKHFPLWLAAYVSGPDAYVPASWKGAGWTLWQHTDKAAVPGISGPCDLNKSKHGLDGLRVSDNRRSK